MVGAEHPPENIHASFLPGIRYSKARKMDVGIVLKTVLGRLKIVWLEREDRLAQDVRAVLYLLGEKGLGGL